MIISFHIYLKQNKNYKMWSSANKIMNKTHKCLRTVIRQYFIYKFSATPTCLNLKFYLYYIIWTEFISTNSESNKKCDKFKKKSVIFRKWLTNVIRSFNPKLKVKNP